MAKSKKIVVKAPPKCYGDPIRLTGRHPAQPMTVVGDGDGGKIIIWRCSVCQRFREEWVEDDQGRA